MLVQHALFDLYFLVDLFHGVRRSARDALGHAARGRRRKRARLLRSLAAGVAEAEDEELINPLPVVETRRLDENEKIGRNDPCWCGSGKKFKKCHGA